MQKKHKIYNGSAEIAATADRLCEKAIFLIHTWGGEEKKSSNSA